MSQVALSEVLAARFGRKPESIRRSLVNWERGHNEPRSWALEAIAEITGQSLDFFRGTSDEARREQQEAGDDDSEAARSMSLLADLREALDLVLERRAAA